MRAIVWTQYGPPEVLQSQEVARPEPKDDELLIRIIATTVTSGDCEQRNLDLPLLYQLPMRAYMGFRRPSKITILGMELAGQVEAVGKDVKRFQVGDQVFGATGFSRMGSNAEYICLPEESEEGALAIKPANMSYEEAAAVPVGGLEALAFLRQGKVQRGQKVLINGAGGTIGPFAVQLARHFGADVSGVESEGKMEMLRSIGANEVIDYVREDFTENGERYDLILDLVGSRSMASCLNALKKNGRYLMANPGVMQRLQGRWASLAGGKKVVSGRVHPKREDLLFLKELIEAGAMKTIIDRRYPLEQVAEAHRYVETGQKMGNVIIVVAQEGIS